MLVRLMCAIALALPLAPALAAEAVVVASTAPGYALGQIVADGTAVTLPEGASALFVFATGRTVRVRGPYDGRLDTMEQTTARPGLGDLVAGRLVQSDLGATRSSQTSVEVDAARILVADPSLPGTQCVEAGRPPLLRRPQDPRFARIEVRDVRDGASTSLTWGDGDQTIPRTLAPGEEAEVTVTGTGGRPAHTLRLRAVAAEPDGVALAVRLAGAGCRDQAAALLAPIRDALAPLDLYLASDRGLYPTYRRGEPIRLVLQTNRDAHVYCYLRDERGQLVPIFPSGASEGSRVEGHRVLTLPGARMPVPMNAGDSAGGREVRCLAARDDLDSVLPGENEAFRPLSEQASARLEHALGTLGDTELVMAQIILRTE